MISVTRATDMMKSPNVGESTIAPTPYQPANVANVAYPAFDHA
ncbi:hypothetical protein R2A130_1484 [Ahrensia sp. R2A130]|nr:hypothetical protein R2A130_1484 [Ahrensia sp. R2A130]